MPAVELSTVDELGEDFHVLGYGIDHTDAALGELLTTWRADRAERIERMAQRLCELGLAPDRAELDARLAAGRPVGRPHLAAAAVAAHRERLEPAGLAEPSAFLEAYLVPGCPAYCRRETPTVPEAIDAIHAAGGVAVWAHPFWDLWQPSEVARGAHALRGRRPGRRRGVLRDPRPRADAAARRASPHELGLLTTGSADFHGPDHRHFSRFRAFDLHGCEPNLGPIAPR